MSLCRDMFSGCPLILGSISKTTNIYWNILGSTYWLCLHEKTVLGNFVYLFIWEVTATKVNFRFYKQCSQATTRLIFKGATFAQNASIVFCSNIPLYIEKILEEKLRKVLEMELKTYTPVDPKFGFEKMKFKVLHYIQHDFICQCQGLSEDQISMFKSPVIN